MNRVAINGADLSALGFYLKEKSITPGEVKSNYVSIPGRNGDLDLTETFDRFYKNGSMSFTLVGVFLTAGDFLNSVTAVINNYHGKYYPITVYDGGFEITRYGRINVGEYQKDGCEGTLTFDVVTDVGGTVYNNVFFGKYMELGKEYSFNLNTGGKTPTAANLVTFGTVTDPEYEYDDIAHVKFNDLEYFVPCTDNIIIDLLLYSDVMSSIMGQVNNKISLGPTTQTTHLTLGFGWTLDV